MVNSEGGRPRDIGEVYIPVPRNIHNVCPNFFPPSNTYFNLHIPNNSILQTKICQENDKALMTNPNRALAQWLLRDVLRLREGELATYQRLELLNFDSVRITKVDNQNYKIDVAPLDAYESFIELFG